MRRVLVGIGLGLLFGLVSVSANADPITFGFSGNVTHVYDSISGTFSIGQDISGFYTFDSETSGESFSPGGILDPSITYYPFALTEFEATIGTYEVSFGADNRIFVMNNNDLGRDRYLIEVLNPVGEDVEGLALDFFALTFEDFQASAFSDGSLPLFPIDLTLFEGADAVLDFGGSRGADDRVQSHITSLFECSRFPGGGATHGCFPGPGPFPVPEPATLALFGLGLLGMGLARRKKA